MTPDRLHKLNTKARTGIELELGKCKLGERPWIAWQFVKEFEEAQGSRFLRVGNTAYFFDGLERRTIKFSDQNAVARYLTYRYSLPVGSNVTYAVSGFMYAYAEHEGTPCELHRFSYYDHAEDVLYISQHNGDVWRIDGETVTTTANGSPALFVDDDPFVPVQPDIGPHGLIESTLLEDVMYKSATEGGGFDASLQRDLTLVWMYFVAFGNRFTVKPLLLVEGEKGSGKTMTIQRMQAMITGRSLPLIVGQNDEADFGVQILRATPIALLDNMDTEVRWLRDAICGYATSGAWVRRKKFTDDEQIVIAPQTCIAIASRNPVTFKRDDITDRCLVLRFQRRQANAAPESVLAKTLALRPKLLGEWLYTLNLIVRELKAGAEETTDQRLAGFGAFAAAFFRATNRDKQRLSSVLGGAQAEREALSLEDDPLVDVLMDWLQTSQGREARDEYLTAGQLYSVLGPIAASRGVPWYESPRALSVRIQNLRSAFERYFNLDVRAATHYRPAAFRLSLKYDQDYVTVQADGIDSPR